MRASRRYFAELPEAGEAVENLPAPLRQARMTVLPVGLEHALKASTLPGPHLDPFDRMLIAQAQVEGLPLLTHDPVFRRYGVCVLW